MIFPNWLRHVQLLINKVFSQSIIFTVCESLTLCESHWLTAEQHDPDRTQSKDGPFLYLLYNTHVLSNTEYGYNAVFEMDPEYRVLAGSCCIWKVYYLFLLLRVYSKSPIVFKRVLLNFHQLVHLSFLILASLPCKFLVMMNNALTYSKSPTYFFHTLCKHGRCKRSPLIVDSTR